MIITLIDNYINIFKGYENLNVESNYIFKYNYDKFSERYCYELYNNDVIIDKQLKKIPNISPYTEAIYSLIYSLKIDTLQIKSSICNFSLLYNYIFTKKTHIKQNILARLLYTMEYNEDCILDIGLKNSEDLYKYLLEIKNIPRALKNLINDFFIDFDSSNLDYQTIENINPKLFYKKIIETYSFEEEKEEELTINYFNQQFSLNTLYIYFFIYPNDLKDFYEHNINYKNIDHFLDSFFQCKYQDLFSQKIFAVILFPLIKDSGSFWKKRVIKLYNVNYIYK